MEPKKRYNALRDKAHKPLIELKATPTILDILDFLQGRILPSHYLKQQFGRPYYIKTLLKDLAKAHLIGVPDGYAHTDARYRPRPRAVFPLGYKMLLEHGKLRAIEKLSSSSFDHDYLAQVIQFSFDRAAIEIPNLKKRTLADILAHPSCPNPKATSEVPEHHIRPDAPLLGFECTLQDGGKKYFYVHGFEADRSTEPLRGFGRQTLEQKLSQYAAYLKGGYRRRYGISNCSAAWFFVAPQRAQDFLELVQEKHPTLTQNILVKVVPDFLHFDPFPPPTAWAVTEDWRLAGGRTLNILDILGAKHERGRNETSQAIGVEQTAGGY